MSFWSRLFGGKQPPVSEPVREPEAPAQLNPHERWLDELAAKVAADPRPLADADRRELFRRLDLLVDEGHPRLAADLAAKLAHALAAVPASPEADLRARAASLYLGAGDTRAALPLLEALGPHREHGAWAHFQLGEHHLREGDLARALGHFEMVVALDVDYPNARVRADAARAALGRSVPAPEGAAPTLVGPEAGPALTARYQLIGELGRGASGAVYRARDAELDREVAIKLLHTHLARGGQGAIGRFFAEARVAASLRHPGIIAILDVDERHLRIVMELARGGTLAGRLASGPLAAAEALARHAEVLEALRAAHRRGVVHRDLKPANLLYREPGGELVLGDFGVAHLGAPAGGAVTAEGSLMYMPPEQRRGVIDPRSDLFAAGAILVEMLTGAPPWDRQGALRGVIDPARLEALPDGVRGHAGALLAADPGARPDTEAALADAVALADRAAAG